LAQKIKERHNYFEHVCCDWFFWLDIFFLEINS
jgi:hypothetical protein